MRSNGWVVVMRLVVAPPMGPKVHLKLAALRRPVAMDGPESVDHGQWRPESDASPTTPAVHYSAAHPHGDDARAMTSIQRTPS